MQKILQSFPKSSFQVQPKPLDMLVFLSNSANIRVLKYNINLKLSTLQFTFHFFVRIKNLKYEFAAKISAIVAERIVVFGAIFAVSQLFQMFRQIVKWKLRVTAIKTPGIYWSRFIIIRLKSQLFTYRNYLSCTAYRLSYLLFEFEGHSSNFRNQI